MFKCVIRLPRSLSTFWTWFGQSRCTCPCKKIFENNVACRWKNLARPIKQKHKSKLQVTCKSPRQDNPRTVCISLLSLVSLVEEHTVLYEYEFKGFVFGRRRRPAPSLRSYWHSYWHANAPLNPASKKPQIHRSNTSFNDLELLPRPPHRFCYPTNLLCIDHLWL